MILLDTHVLYWMANESTRLSARARLAITQAREESGLTIAAITLRELAWMVQMRRIIVAGSVESYLKELISRVIVQPITAEIAGLSVRLPDKFPKDPADCLIVATAMVEGMPLVTADRNIQRSKVLETIW